MENKESTVQKTPLTKGQKNNLVKEKSFALAVRIVKLHRYLVSAKGEYTISKQLLRSGTNPGAMVREAQNAESDADFVHKLGIAQKETDETLYWLELLYAAEVLNETEFTSLHKDTEEVLMLLRTIILSKKANMLKNKATAIITTLIICWSVVHFL